jgi:hypothetical protein
VLRNVWALLREEDLVIGLERRNGHRYSRTVPATYARYRPG